MPRRLLPVLLALATTALAAQRGDRYALILKALPTARQVISRAELNSAKGIRILGQLRSGQQSLQTELRARGIGVIGSSQVLLNAVYVTARPSDVAMLRSLPGVERVAKMERMRPHLNRALALMNVPAAWNLLGGQANAGAGVKIGILDTGIDEKHPAFQDSGLTMPAGYPKCQGTDCQYATNKVIAVRSYVDLLVESGMPQFSRPDDLSPTDRVGHGTAAAMIAAGNTVQGPVATITGVAPKAWLGNYKIFGSPGVNDFTFTDVLIRAMEDALSDGMDVITVNVGTPAVWGPLDNGATCGNAGNDPCDARAAAVENAINMGLTVTVSAGNDGDVSSAPPAPGSINSPGTAPSAITVGATTNAHSFYSAVKASGQSFRAVFGDSPKPGAAFSAPLADATAAGDALACNALSGGSLYGKIAVVQQGGCDFSVKTANAQAAGAAGVIVVSTSDFLFPIVGANNAGVPTVLISGTDGASLLAALKSNSGLTATIDPALSEVSTDAQADMTAYFTSRGPAIRTGAIKPELAAVGTALYTATQRSDPNGDLYDPSGFTAVQGTSFAAAAVAGGVALVKQANPGWGPAQLKSAVVNTANPNITEFFAGGTTPASVTAVGAGKLDAGAAVQSTVTVAPATLSFGIVSGVGAGQTITVTNNAAAPATLNLTVNPRTNDAKAHVALSAAAVTIPAHGSTDVSATLAGSTPGAGSYEGTVQITGGAVKLTVPYLYLLGDAVPFSSYALGGDGFVGTPGQSTFLTAKVVDRYGVPVANAPVRFYSVSGGGSVTNATSTTDDLGIAEATVILGSQTGPQQFAADIANPAQLTLPFAVTAIPVPAITAGGIVNTANGQPGAGAAPGSYITIYGTGLSGITRLFNTATLPLSLAGISVSFDVPGKNLSLPGYVEYVSGSQINVQVPWELAGNSSAQVKISFGDISSTLYTLQLSDYSPGLFEYTESGTGAVLAAALDANNAPLGSAHPAAAGSTVELFASGLGPVDHQPPSGAPGPQQPLARTSVTPSVTIGGVGAEVSFSGLAPGNIGLYQLNVVVPPGVKPGLAPVIVTANGAASKPTNLPVQ